MSDSFIKINTLSVSKNLADFVKDELLPGLDINPETFWESFERVLDEFGPRNKELLAKRTEIQKTIDNWHISKKGSPHNHDEYVNFLKEIGYLLEEGDDFEITTQNVDEEISLVAGAQLVVPIMNARFSLNATNTE